MIDYKKRSEELESLIEDIFKMQLIEDSYKVLIETGFNEIIKQTES